MTTHSDIIARLRQTDNIEFEFQRSGYHHRTVLGCFKAAACPVSPVMYVEEGYVLVSLSPREGHGLSANWDTTESEPNGAQPLPPSLLLLTELPQGRLQMFQTFSEMRIWEIYNFGNTRRPPGC